MKIFPSKEDKLNGIAILSFCIGFYLAIWLFNFNIDLVDSIALMTALIAVAALLWQINANTSQAKMQTYLTYTQRYQDIVINLPIGVESSTYNLPSDDDEKEKILRWLRAYFDLCSEQYHLNEKKLIDKKVWELWKGGMSDSLQKPAFQKSWISIQKNDYYHEEFANFIDSIINK